jgi:hypothetical protein
MMELPASASPLLSLCEKYAGKSGKRQNGANRETYSIKQEASKQEEVCVVVVFVAVPIHYVLQSSSRIL